MTDPRLSAAERTREAFLRETLARAGGDTAEEVSLADAYWRRYPDVAANGMFGRNGVLGRNGAREHYQRHGRHEGRIWGADGGTARKPGGVTPDSPAGNAPD